MAAMDMGAPHGQNKIPSTPRNRFLGTVVDTFAENCMLGQLTQQWADVPAKTLWDRQRRRWWRRCDKA